ncbi:FKBP-type peptidyl-prolyl cis-trans isomerase [Arenimonas composti]|uniref:Peptidyl-prolyl cis-trans isomerase n=1 Tax=Arenimonas composti TR7-09 = DSM 18010 TaxID=1121013 RepID=A0A091B966_9GAMM|nr:FKBP-type peptidyl-prolyl cis-trans isomerase [Arenimonas composti]KFN47374.1 hypothetical protein P873_01650 [Arenimonas composti TR7-09 = DSM 18010]
MKSKVEWLLVLVLATTVQAAPPQPLAAPPAQAVEAASGMAYVVLKAGPDQGNLVRGEFVEYRADVWSADGVARASAREDGNRVVPVRALARQQPALARALMLTPVGETRRWWIQPERLAPGYPGMPNLPHVIELTVIGEANPLQAPPDVAAVPDGAQRSASGLAWKVLRRGGGSDHPGPNAVIEIDYTGWTADGRPFDSSLRSGGHAFLPLAGLIPGWQEGLPLMSRGDSFRFWIPGHLGYDASPDPTAPRGMLVFDVTLYGWSE